MTEQISVDTEVFLPVEVREEHLEGLLQGSSAFGRFRYVPFRPPIRGPDGVRHPDGALVAEGSEEWWVVEIEVHRHDVDRHVRPQLLGLAAGVYGPAAMRHLRARGVTEGIVKTLRSYEPRFMLIADHLTPGLRAAAHEAGFEQVECAVFRSGLNRYALAVSGSILRDRHNTPEQGVDVSLTDVAGVAVLEMQGVAEVPGWLPYEITVGEECFRVRVTRDARIALPLSPAECRRLAAGANHYRLTTRGHLVAHA